MNDIRLTDIRVRSQITDVCLEAMHGRIVTDYEYDVVLTGPSRVSTPSGALLAVYLPGAIPEEIAASAYPVLHSLRTATTDNRGLASGTRRVQVGQQDRTRSARIRSTIIGAFDPSAMYKYCRLTAWTGENIPRYRELFPLFQSAAEHFQKHVPDRYEVQTNISDRTDPAWRIPDTPFTTITVNNTYPTGVHTDAGDLDEGFSCLTVLRRGSYSGGLLTFPRYRIAVDMYDGDLILMNAHEWHGNTQLTPKDEAAERISVVMYYRTEIAKCGSPEAEHAKAQHRNDLRNGFWQTAPLPIHSPASTASHTSPEPAEHGHNASGGVL